MTTPAKKTVLLSRLSALGDIVHTWPLAEALAQTGRFRVVWLVEDRFLPLVKCHPAVDQVIVLPIKHWRGHLTSSATFREIVAALRACQQLSPTIALDPQGLVKSALWPALARVPVRIGFAHSHRREVLAGLFYTQVTAPPPELFHVVDFNLALALPLGVPATFGVAPDGSFLQPHLPPPPAEAKAVLLFPGSGNPKKNWPTASFVELAAALLARGWPVTVIWGPGERHVAAAIAQRVPNCRLAPPTDLWQLASFLNAAIAVIGGDTGPIHLAAAFGVPTLAIHLVTDPRRNGPRGPRVAWISGARLNRSLKHPHTGAARAIHVDDVLQAFLKLMAGRV